MTRAIHLSEKSRAFAELIGASVFTDAAGRELGSERGMKAVLGALQKIRKEKRSVFVAGNGGSAAVASHVITDLVNTGNVDAQTLHEPSLLTCMANDYGYQNAYGRILSRRFRKGDLGVLISSSGKSQNMLKAAQAIRKIGGIAVTLTGFKSSNALRKMGDINIWVDSREYGAVEVGHLYILHVIADLFQSKK